VARRDVADLVGHDASQLGFVSGEREEAAGDTDVAARQRRPM
jgi:hypothetical protein